MNGHALSACLGLGAILLGVACGCAAAERSAPVDLRGYGMIGLIVPTITPANLTFTVSETQAGAYVTVYNEDGQAWTLTTAAGNRAISADDMAPLCAYRWVRVVTSVAQGAQRVFRFVVKA